MGSGAIAVPCSTLLPPEGLAYVFKDSDAKLVIVSPEQLAECEGRPAPPDCSRQGFSQECRTRRPSASSTAIRRAWCSTPRAAPASRKARCTATATCRGRWRAWRARSTTSQPDDRLFSVPRLFFAYGLGNSLSIPLGSGASTILLSERPSPALIGEVFAKYRPDHLLRACRPCSACCSSMCGREQHRYALAALRGFGRRSAAARHLERVEGADRHARSSRPSAPPSCCMLSSTTIATATAPAARRGARRLRGASWRTKRAP